MKEQSKSKQIAVKTIYGAFKILKANGGEMRGKDVVNKLRETLKFDEYENHRFEKTGYIRWESILHFYTIDCIKAGFLLKSKGLWILTKEGEEAMKLGDEKLLTTATKIYRENGMLSEKATKKEMMRKLKKLNKIKVKG
jgi:restriction system protein